MKKWMFAIMFFFWASSSQAAYIDNGNGTVTDTTTGLMWQQATAKTATGRTTMIWKYAISYCENLNLGGYTDWRLPTIKELRSIVDYSRYNPAIDTNMFKDTVAYCYWSSSTSAGYINDAWGVHFHHGGDYGNHKDDCCYYVRAVRSGQSVIGSFAHLTISDISPLQQVGKEFSVTITAVGVDGYQDIGYNKTLSLSSTAGYGTVTPTSIQMQNGQWHGAIKISEESCNMTLSVYSGSFPACVSSPFNVNGSGGVGSLGGEIKDNYGNKVGADVKIQLSGCQSYSKIFSGGSYQIDDIDSGTYKLTATHISSGITFETEDLFIRGGSGMTKEIEFVFSSATYGKIPVLLIAGVMGSQRKSDLIVCPRLPAQHGPDGSELKLVNNGVDKVGWESLKNKLKQANYVPEVTLFEVPYDWRMHINQIYDEYLIKAITKAKDKSGQNKVNIIAHSMGGLVTRAYIQSDKYDNDIDRFAMVGTPNLGSGTAYYLWEGGDPKLADDIVSWGVWLAGNFYYSVVNANYKIVHNESVDDDEYEKIFNYLHDTGGKNAMYGLEQLLPTYNFLKKDIYAVPATLSKNPNTFLILLNNDSKGIEKMGLQNNTDNKVKTIVFAGKSVETIESVFIGEAGNPLYVDGCPRPAHKEGSAYMTTDGDRTVRLVSAIWPASQKWASQGAIKNGEHSSLIKTYASELVRFVEGEFISDKSAAGEREAARSEEIDVKSFAVSIIGRPQMYLVDSTNNGTGINNLTQQRESDIPESDVIFDEEGGSISVDNLLDGVYTLYITGVYAEDYMLDLSFTDQEKTVLYSYRGFNNAETDKITILVDSVSSDRVKVQGIPVPPIGFKANPQGTASLTTQLSWTASSDSSVTGYRIYSRQKTDRHFVLDGESTTPSFATTHTWSGNTSVPVRIFAVSAVKADGSESFFSDTISNDDRDHDGLTDEKETELGTDMTKADTDGDGLDDGKESAYGTNPTKPDTDGDTYSDYAEVQAQSDPLDSSSIPTAQTQTHKVLTDSSPSLSISSGENIKVYGSSGINTLNISSGAKIECINFPGANVINLVDDSPSDFTVRRSGATVYFESTAKGTILKIPATKTIQAINFNGGVSYNLVINNGKVMLGSKEITTAKVQL